jgi:uncharacterized Zn finger protein (UPF0148 family)
MNCKVCNTRLGGREKHCPNCGTTVVGSKADKRSAAKRAATRLTPDASSAQDLDIDIDDLEQLDDISRESPSDSSSSRSVPARKPKAATARRKTAATPLARPDPDGVRALLADNPSLLEDGMSVFRGADGKAVGAGYSTDVGEIDLLATDAKGGIVVVMVADKGQAEELIPDVLQRIGWAGKHLAPGKRKVRAIILVDDAPESLNYAAAAVADTIGFKTYLASISFEDLEI